MTTRPFRFGVTGARYGASLSQWHDFVREAEDSGYSTVLLPDHLGPQLAPLPALVSAATITSTLRLGTLVLDNDFRHPGILAKEAASLDVLTSGRFELGIGAGWMEDEYRTLGLPFSASGERVSRLEEAVRIIKGSLSGTPLTLDGRYYQVRALTTEPRPIQHPLPLLIGGGRRRMLTLAAREATTVALMDGPVAASDQRATPRDNLATKVRLVREVAGDRYPVLELNIFVARVEVDAPADSGGLAPYGMSRVAEDGSPWALVGSVDTVVEALQAQRDEFDISYICVFGPAIKMFAPVVARLAGT